MRSDEEKWVLSYCDVDSYLFRTGIVPITASVCTGVFREIVGCGARHVLHTV